MSGYGVNKRFGDPGGCARRERQPERRGENHRQRVSNHEAPNRIRGEQSPIPGGKPAMTLSTVRRYQSGRV